MVNTEKAAGMMVSAARFINTVKQEGTLAFAADEYAKTFGSGSYECPLTIRLGELESLTQTFCAQKEIDKAMDGIINMLAA